MADVESCTCVVPDMSSIAGSVFCIGCGCPISIWGQNTQSDPVLSEISSNTPASHFIHKPLLESTHFRLIRVLPGRDRDPIYCEILRFNIEDRPPYEAVSYTWGNISTTENIYTQTGPLDVTVNCKAALSDLRGEYCDRLLWIDAVCINQADISEKNHQVPLMNKIYSEADCVLIHLGQDLTPRLRDFFHSLRDGTTAYHDQDFTTSFLSRPWFSRVWVLQEVAMAKKALVIAGRETLDWKFLTPGRLHALGHQALNDEGKIPPVLVQRDKKPFKDLISLISAARGCSSTNPRDKIYALIGLLENPKDLPLVPDYNLPVKSLFSNVTAQVIEKYKHLDILTDVGTHNQQKPVMNDAKPASVLHRSALSHVQWTIRWVLGVGSLHGSMGTLDRSRRLIDSLTIPDYESTTSVFIELRKPWQGMKRLVEQASKSQGLEGQEIDPDEKASYDVLDQEELPEEKMLYDVLGVSAFLESSAIFRKALLWAFLQAWPVSSIPVQLLNNFVAGASQLPISDRKVVRDMLYLVPLTLIMEKAPETFHRLAEGMTLEEMRHRDLSNCELVSSIPSWVADFSGSRQLSSLAYWRPVQRAQSGSPIASIRAIQSCETQFRRVGHFLKVKLLRLESIKVFGLWNKPGGPVFISRDHFEGTLTQPCVDFSLLENFDTMDYGRSFQDIQTFSRGRDMRLTKRSLAICPPAARDLDIVCILDGASVPFVVRPLSEDMRKFLLVGECYLHGCKGPKFADNYLELIGQYRQFFDAETSDDLPWETVYLV